MSATSWVIWVFYILGFVGLGISFSMWFLTRHHEDDIWRWILSIAGMLLFGTAFWVSYFFGTTSSWWTAIFIIPICYSWLMVVIARRTPAMLDRIVFPAFGTLVIAFVLAGGYGAGLQGWWGMAIAFYFVAFGTCFTLLKP